MAVDIDSVLESIGEFGWYQKKTYFLLCLPVIFVGAANLSYTFIAASPDYRCYVPGCDIPKKDGPEYNATFINFTIPRNEKTGLLDMCHKYVRNSKIESCKKTDFEHKEEDCVYGYVFDKSIYQSTIVTEFNLTCSNAWQYKADQSIYFAGMLVGAFLFGLMSDNIGRRITILIGIVFMASSGVMIALAPNFISFHIMRFINAMSSSGVFQTAFILGLEFVGPGKRVMFGVIGQYFFAFGEVLLGLIAYFIRRWRLLQLVLSVPVTVFGFYYWVVPESLRWLQAKGHHAKVVSQLEIIAKTNKTTIPLHLLRHQDVEEDESNVNEDFAVLLTNRQRVGLFDIVKSLSMSLRTIFMIIIWITTTLTYYGISFTSVDLGGSTNPFVDFIIAAVAELPGYTLAWLGMTLIGRKISLMLSLMLSGLACIVVAYVAKYPTFLLVSFFLGKCFITSAFAIIYIYTAEMYPTSVRNSIIGVCSMMARIGGMCAPFVAAASTKYPPLPMLIFGISSIVSSFLTLIFPETLNTKLPETLLEAINIGNRREPLMSNTSNRESPYADDQASLLDNRSGDESDTHPIG